MVAGAVPVDRGIAVATAGSGLFKTTVRWSFPAAKAAVKGSSARTRFPPNPPAVVLYAPESRSVS